MDTSSHRHPVRSAAVAIVAAVTAALGLVAAAPAASAMTGGDPPGTVTVTPNTPSTYGTVLEPLVGSPSYLVYSKGNRLAAHDYMQGEVTDSSSEHLYSRDEAGVTTDLGPTPVGFELTSIAGHILSGPSSGTTGAVSDTTNQISWWNLAAHTSGQVSLPRTDIWVSSSPDGFVYTDGTDLFDETTSGTVTPLGHPYAFSNGFVSGVADSNGLVINGLQQPSGPTELFYMPWSNPGTYRSLDTATTDSVECSVVDASYAGCTSFTTDSDGDEIPVSTELIPLDGGAPTVAAPTYDEFALFGSTAVFRDSKGLESFSVADPTFTSGSPTLAARTGLIGGTSSDPYGTIHEDVDATISAYGEAVMLNHALNKVYQATDATTSSMLFEVPQSPVAAGGFSLTSHKVVYADDQPVAGSAGHFATQSASITRGDGGALSVSSPTLVKADTYYAEVGASTTLTVYAKPHGIVTDLYVVGYGRTHLIQHFAKFHLVAPGAPFQVSGHRVLYRLTPGTDAPWYVYNAKTNRTKTIQVPDSTQTYPTLDGHYLAYVHHTGQITREDLVTGAKTHVATPIKVVNRGSLFMHGDDVGWSLTNESLRHPKEVNGYRNVATMAAPVRFTRSVYELNGFGVVLASTDLLANTDTYWGITSGFTLKTYSGASTTLLPAANYVQGPEIAGPVMAWIDTHGVLKVAPVPTS